MADNNKVTNVTPEAGEGLAEDQLEDVAAGSDLSMLSQKELMTVLKRSV